MIIEPFGELHFIERDKVWFGMADNISPENKVELSIAADSKEEDISFKIKSIEEFALDYPNILDKLYNILFLTESKLDSPKSIEQLKEMYFFTAVSLKPDNKTWWLTLEPHFHVPSIYNHFIRYTMFDRKIIWSNLNIHKDD
ncbi:hypothetical protein EZ428_07220 [Pedobacter frigiditerrae]|uniref:Uncharacterized protein n=1 Tax=Pedobacter frigiditerrae TaxID=2530452 RepID=A0A4R0MWF4_9SPHI|nr:hypothetical protein [Pedobacter frigiditerrae]TCC91548.1 hypothetical protein EZ428_07220 [Pedobacter frigiditerrae]